MHRFVCTLLGLSMIAAQVVGAEPKSTPDQPIIGLEEIRAGQDGYGLSVFSGNQPERFEVEVLGVWRQVQPDTSYILARLSGRDLDASGVVAGMSGSPVYVDGRLAGAVAFAWPFSLDPVAGITPIETMQRLSAVETAGPPPLRKSVSLRQLAAADLPRDLLQRRLAELISSPLEGAGNGVAWSATGFGPDTRGLLGRSLGSVAPAGRSEGGGQAAVVAGASVAGVLVDGDLQLAATGTITQRVGEQVLAFGHPFLGIGPIQVPMATSEVLTVLSNQLNSFKITNLGDVVGVFDLDRSTGVRGELGRGAPMTTMRVEVRGDRRRELELRLARVPTLTPTLAAISLLGSLETVTQAAGTQGLDLRARFAMPGHGELEIDQSFDGESAGFDAALYLLAFADYLLNNSLEEIDLSEIEVELVQHPEPRTAMLVEAHASKTLLRPGETVSLNLDLMAYRGERLRRSLEVAIPTSLPDGRYSLLVGDGVSIDVARLTIEQTVPVTFAQALRLLSSFHSRRELVVLGVFGGKGLAVAGEVLPRLPGSIRSLWAAAGSSSAIPLELAIAQQQEMQMSMPVVGAARVDLEVRREGPLGPEPSDPDGVDDDSSSSSGPPSARPDSATRGEESEEGSH